MRASLMPLNHTILVDIWYIMIGIPGWEDTRLWLSIPVCYMSHTRILTGLVLYMSCASNHSCCQFMYVTAM